SAIVDVVAITVKVPYHLELATAALDAGKAIYCEWPLGNGLKEAETLAALAKKKGVLAVAGLQARSAPSVAYVHDLIKQGYVGEVLSTSLIGSGMGWGPTVEPYNAYVNDKKNGATMLSIALGHAADALCHCLGDVRQPSLEVLPVPKKYRWSPPQGPSTNVAQAYGRFAHDYREGTHLCPTFDDAVTRHRMLDAIETAAATGQRQTLR